MKEQNNQSQYMVQLGYSIVMGLLVFAVGLVTAGMQHFLSLQLEKHPATLTEKILQGIWLVSPWLFGLLVVSRHRAHHRNHILTAVVIALGALPAIAFGLSMLSDSVQGEEIMGLLAPWGIGWVTVVIGWLICGYSALRDWQQRKFQKQ